ncbi:Arc family DNA-binding protein [Stutzerimonas kunmingensis]|jgi:predicted HicB family RNase H-like nuclease|uniref:Arc family DNA-binding protein n=1 Tax=Stutzerimonas kunmingensis TaxID=1211807 RepID=UPI0035CF55CC
MKHVTGSPDTVVRMVIRIPTSMRERLAEVAGANHRSMNSEIISILERSLVPVTEATQEHPE